MDKLESTKLLLNMASNLMAVAKLIYPEADHFSCFTLEGDTDIRVLTGNRKNVLLLDAHHFVDDGTVQMNEEYERKGWHKGEYAG